MKTIHTYADIPQHTHTCDINKWKSAFTILLQLDSIMLNPFYDAGAELPGKFMTFMTCTICIVLVSVCVCCGAETRRINIQNA